MQSISGEYIDGMKKNSDTQTSFLKLCINCFELISRGKECGLLNYWEYVKIYPCRELSLLCPMCCSFFVNIQWIKICFNFNMSQKLGFNTWITYFVTKSFYSNNIWYKFISSISVIRLTIITTWLEKWQI